ncbi:hypothetical protein H9X85_11220 [Anaerotignum lactatifermentans]|uniref:FMN-binding domain-containing protein n=1 Tax=Anaerotignum lactatifermentans TaxID=160404 RepID=A0ABS2GDX4_9FIRM|nr:hypothetical protein [Anaerotignum lactatifermentans]MBM6830151.1 hypothetical protein [Anaerotignum lactatifermentans]MBM6878704.1 hypothetical protein [Anaerotignum lactatifermentans]MBM6951764.1 hypothetical protein [Anaerotignum lactatifermentans]
MRHTKFVVVKMRELLKTAVFAVLGVVILAGLITFFLRMGSGEESAGLYRDGSYEAALETGSVDAVVCVQIEKGKVKDVTLKETSEALTVMYPLVETAVEEVRQEVKGKAPDLEDTAQWDTYSQQTVWEAVAQCLSEARTK